MKFSSTCRSIGSGRSNEVLISPSSAYLTGETRSNIHATREKSSAFRLIPPFIPFDSKLPHSLVADACRRNGRQNGVTFFFQTQPRAIWQKVGRKNLRRRARCYGHGWHFFISEKKVLRLESISLNRTRLTDTTPFVCWVQVQPSGRHPSLEQFASATAWAHPFWMRPS